MNVYFYTLGCKVNQYESQEMSELFKRRGYTVLQTPEKADIIVVNSCTVTAESVRKVRQSVRKLKKEVPSSVMVLTGCASQAEPEIIKDLPEVDVFLGNKTNCDIVNATENFLKTHTFTNDYERHETGDDFKGDGITGFDGHTRAFLKIQDGCDRFCSYCLIPTARGRSRSKPLELIDKELKALSDNGYKEIVFVGINLSDYGKNTPYSLPDALLLSEKYDGLKRVRLGSLEPDHITDEMIKRLKTVTKLCPQFHISVQSGCDSVLKSMNRHYTAKEYEELVTKLRKAFSDTTITTDILVGFPSESDNDFVETVNFAKRVAFEKVHVFPYSKRNGTPAAKMAQLTNAVKDERARKLTKEVNQIRSEFMKEQIGKTVEVLFENEHPDYSEGYTKNYIPVKIYDDKKRTGEIVSVKIISSEDDCCIGE